MRHDSAICPTKQGAVSTRTTNSEWALVAASPHACLTHYILGNSCIIHFHTACLLRRSTHMTSSPHTVSVVIPAYRCRDTLLDVLAAIRAQTLTPAEVIVVDDCSPDALEQLLAPVLHEITYLRNTRNLGLSKSYNRGLRTATSEYLLTLHSDCILAPDYIATLCRTLSAHPDIGVATGRSYHRDFSALPLTEQLFNILNLISTGEQGRAPAEDVVFIEGKADLFRTNELTAMNYFSEALTLTAEDQDLSARYRLRGFRLLQNNEAIFHSRNNGTQDSLWKVLRKQFTYAKGQAYILLTYGLYAVKPSTRERNYRVFHRASQLISTLVCTASLLASFLWPCFLLIALTLLTVRAVYYVAMAYPMKWPHRLVVVPTGFIADALYSIGLTYGAALFCLTRKA